MLKLLNIQNENDLIQKKKKKLLKMNYKNLITKFVIAMLLITKYEENMQSIRLKHSQKSF